MQSTGSGADAAEQSSLLVEEVVDDFDLGAGFEVVWKQHDRYRHLAQVIHLRMSKEEKERENTSGPHKHVSSTKHEAYLLYRVIDPPHQDAQHRVTGSENLHLLLHEVFLLGLPLGLQSGDGGGGVGRRHGSSSGVSVREQVVVACEVLLCM